jgi:arabinan endo-1,5-alpha-L-arabinosidase
MNWRLRGEAFTTKPSWSINKITGISAAFARTRASYYVFYTLGSDSLGMAVSRAPQGPFNDLGLFKSAADFGLQQLTDPFFFPFGSRAYIFFNGGDGIYGQELTLARDALATTTGSAFKVAGDHIKSISITRYANIYYLFGVVEDGDNSLIVVGRSINVTGPYLDKDGTDMLQDGGTPVLQGSAENGFIDTDHIGGVFAGSGNNLWILYQATDIDKPQLSSGSDRHPLMLSLLSFDDEFWPAETTIVQGGWNCTRFTR